MRGSPWILLCVPALLSSCGGAASTPDAAEPPALEERLSATARSVLAAPDLFEIVSLDPHSMMRRPPADAILFHDAVELGRATVHEVAPRQQIVRLIYEGILENDETVAACFNPRHGVHAVRGEHVVDLVICYECLQVHVYVDGAREVCLTGESVEPALSRLWREHGLEIAR